MNGKAIVIDAVFGIYRVEIINFDNGNEIERHEGGFTRNKAYEVASTWQKETGYPVRLQHGPHIINIEKRDQIHYKLNQ